MIMRGDRAWMAIGGLLVGGVTYYVTSTKSNTALEALVNTQKATETLTQMMAVQQADAFLRAPDLQLARRHLGPECMPATDEQRRAVLDLADAYVNFSLTMDLTKPGFFTEKYGAYVERLLATPFMQDQLLENPARWKSLVEIGQRCILTRDDAPEAWPALDTLARREATTFLSVFDKEARDCRQRIADILRETDPSKRAAAKDAMRQLVAGHPESGLYLYCPYTQRNAKKLMRERAAALPTEHDKVAASTATETAPTGK